MTCSPLLAAAIASACGCRDRIYLGVEALWQKPMAGVDRDQQASSGTGGYALYVDDLPSVFLPPSFSAAQELIGGHVLASTEPDERDAPAPVQKARADGQHHHREASAKRCDDCRESSPITTIACRQ